MDIFVNLNSCVFFYAALFYKVPIAGEYLKTMILFSTGYIGTVWSSSVYVCQCVYLCVIFDDSLREYLDMLSLKSKWTTPAALSAL